MRRVRGRAPKSRESSLSSCKDDVLLQVSKEYQRPRAPNESRLPRLGEHAAILAAALTCCRNRGAAGPERRSIRIWHLSGHHVRIAFSRDPWTELECSSWMVNGEQILIRPLFSTLSCPIQSCSRHITRTTR